MKKEPTPADFAKAIAQHVMTIEHDAGVYRSLHFGKPGSSIQSFRIVTFPGSLVYTGDMGTFVFERLRDMFQFFRRETINPQYWAEKVQAADRCDGLKTFSEEKWAEAVRDELKQFLERYADDGDGEWFRHARVIWPEVKSLIRGGASNSYEAVDATQHFECDDADGEQVGSRIFEGFWERSVEEYSYRFIWCCRALVWAIAQYDAAKAPQAALEEAAQ